jgi:hypothetical protein
MLPVCWAMSDVEKTIRIIAINISFKVDLHIFPPEPPRWADTARGDLNISVKGILPMRNCGCEQRVSSPAFARLPPPPRKNGIVSVNVYKNDHSRRTFWHRQNLRREESSSERRSA